MAIATFGVTYTTLAAHHFPALTPSTASKPTAATMTEKVKDGAADLAGRLAQKGITAANISEDDHPNAYQWASKYVRLYAAIGALQAGATADPEVVKAWRAELKDMQEALAEHGYLALGGDLSAPSEAAEGVLTHISNHDLDVGDETDISDVIPTFRRSDQL